MRYLSFLLLSTVCLSFDVQGTDAATCASTEPSPLFKIGFEFQEAHHMCPWAIEAPEIRSVPIFSVCQGERVLWDLTIDWQDLEFVTMPIANHEMDILQTTMNSIKTACDALVELNENSKSVEHSHITFAKWIKHFAAALRKVQAPSNSILSIKLPHANFSNSLTVLSFGSFHFPVGPGKRFDFIFQPQVTIQHHLSHSINICLGLLINRMEGDKEHGAFDINNCGATYLKNFIECTDLFTKREDSTEVSFPLKSSSQSGFLFLHMLTCIDLSHTKEVPCAYNCDLDLTNSTDHTQNMCWLHYGSGQINAKSSVNFLSRRPFSSMWKDIAPGQNYAAVLRKHVIQEFLDDLTTKFNQMNYGEC